MMTGIIQTGRRAALAAGVVLRRNYLKPHRLTLKSAIDPVTETDLEAQEVIMGLIRQAYPEHDFLAEEMVGEGAKGLSPLPPPPHPLPQTLMGEREGHRWIIDPLDGTVNFAHGFPMFCSSIAFEAEGRVAYGVVYDPLRDELFEAWAGGGAWLNGEPIRVSSTARLEAALLATGFPYDVRERLPRLMPRLAQMLARAQGVRRAGSAALDLCYVACGRCDGFWEENLKPWDTAAATLIVAEAGGRLSTFEGGVFAITSPTLVASNGVLHEPMLQALGV